MKALITGETLELRSDGTFVRDYLYVKDVVAGYILLAENIQRLRGYAYNVGSSDTFSVLDLFKEVEKTLKHKVPYKILNTAKNEIPYQSLDYSKIKQHLGWQQQWNIEKTITTIYEWYRKVL
jgi:CDP-glucose 4,6-dehydratase